MIPQFPKKHRADIEKACEISLGTVRLSVVQVKTLVRHYDAIRLKAIDLAFELNEARAALRNAPTFTGIHYLEWFDNHLDAINAALKGYTCGPTAKKLIKEAKTRKKP